MMKRSEVKKGVVQAVESSSIILILLYSTHRGHTVSI